MFSNPTEPGTDIPVGEMTDNTDNSGAANSGTGNPTFETTGSSDGAPVVPEPGSLLMLAIGSGMSGAAWFRRRRRTEAGEAQE